LPAVEIDGDDNGDDDGQYEDYEGHP